MSGGMSRGLLGAVLGAVLLAACGGGQQPPAQPPGGGSGDAPVGVVKDTRPEIVQRRDKACAALEPRLVQCAVADARAQHAAGKITQEQLAADTAPEIQRGLAAKWRKKCGEGYMSSRQIRVLEVCHREESECAPLEACLRHLAPDAK